MRGRPIVNVISLAAALALLASSVASAQLEEPAPTEPPAQFKGIKTAVLRSEITEAAVNAAVESAAIFGHTEIGGLTEGKKNGLTSLMLPTASNVVIAARDLAAMAYDLVVISGGDSQATLGFAAAYPNTVFLDIDQPAPCITADGRPDPSGTCAGGTAATPGNYMAVGFDVDQAAYLAGVVAAAASRDDVLGIISAWEGCAECNRYIAGFLSGARSVKPEIELELAYLTDDGVGAFADRASAKTFAKAFIDVYQPDVILPVLGASSLGVIQAACEADILAIGIDLDVAEAYPDLGVCVLTSITKDLGYAVREAIFSFANQTLVPEWRLGLADGHVAATDDWTRLAGLPVDLAERYAEAEQAVITGQVETCPGDCGEPVQLGRLPAGVEPRAAPSPDPGD